MLAEYARDATLSRPVSDLHGARALSLFPRAFLAARGCHLFAKGEPAFEPYRDCGKHVNFGELFLAEPATSHATCLRMTGLDLDLSTFVAAASRRHLDRPGLFSWQVSLCREAERTGRVELPFTGQSRSFPRFRLSADALAGLWRSHPYPHIAEERRQRAGGDRSKDRTSEIVNFPVQTTAANVVLRVQHHLLRLLRFPLHSGPHPLIFLNGYDALSIDCPAGTVSDVDSAFTEAVRLVSTSDYWGLLQSRLGRTVPLLF
jgi:hypothetical protein